jgi:Arc/MetJ-type ribon-helix-helix transcriptional regulator
MQFESVMAVSLTPQNKRTLKRLLKTGRWNNESEIMRYGLHLVAQEVEHQRVPLVHAPQRHSSPEEFARHMASRAGTWTGKLSGKQLLKKTRG